MNIRRSTLLGTAIAFAMYHQSASAQSAANESPAGSEEIEEVIVTGIRASLDRSLEVKRNADTRLEVVTAEDVGKLPAHNVADALRGLPGVNISSASADEGGFDESDRVSLRGTSPSLTQTLINGHSVGSADWFVLSQFNNVGRSVSYTLLPSEMVNSVEVHKSSHAMLQEGGTTGSVNIITRKPFQFDKSVTFEASLGSVYSDQADSYDPQISGLFNYKNEEGTFGMLLQVFKQSARCAAMPRKFRAASSRLRLPTLPVSAIRTSWVCRLPASSGRRCSNRRVIAWAACWPCSTSLRTM
jgi:iron complex outermembrane receptor protein